MDFLFTELETVCQESTGNIHVAISYQKDTCMCILGQDLLSQFLIKLVQTASSLNLYALNRILHMNIHCI